MVIYANQGIRASIPAMEQVFKTILEDGSTAGVESSLWPVIRILKDIQHLPVDTATKGAVAADSSKEIEACVES